ncbi:FCD domain-containing protein [Streptomyces sp. SID4919]|uniref:GntR family transcriptional regulator n=1 Tax=unclassified Streptomyces TaxID=2593676 RepID=UPI000823BFB1|nr:MULTISPECIES: GntR family transcriptional regulator [unclassified Streptomyces]MYY10723.1 FCD domain-containing protein [Streptomyces sp. SID4919]SCK62374.1 transcriptional regulator, GntR family [Streptomyces sp. AmelKG-E11A]
MLTTPPTAAGRAYAQLRSEILDGVLPPGTPLFEVEQSERLGVSRTPVREALSRLVAEGLAEPSAKRGLVVTQVDDRDVRSLFELRSCLEAQAAQLAAVRGDPAVFAEFGDHFTWWRDLFRGPAVSDGQVSDYFALIRRFDEAVNEATDNSFLVDAMEALRTHVARLRRMAGHSQSRLEASASEHSLIARAISRRDAALSAHATHVHLNNSVEHFRQSWRPAETDATEGQRPTTATETPR